VLCLRLLRLFPVLGVILLCLRDSADATSVLEFTDGRKITVSNYKEIGQSVRVYTPNGSFSFRKEDIARIINQDPPQPARSVQTPAETPPPVRQVKNENPPVSSPVTPRAATYDELPPLPGWDYITDVMMEGLHRARFFVALLIGLKVLQFFLPASLR
jgi:hypothetical protein